VQDSGLRFSERLCFGETVHLRRLSSRCWAPTWDEEYTSVAADCDYKGRETEPGVWALHATVAAVRRFPYTLLEGCLY
jgi:hypothetical protein